MPLPCDQVLQWISQHAPPGYRFRRESRLAEARVSKPEPPLYICGLILSSRWRRGFLDRAAPGIRRENRHYVVGVASGEAAGRAVAFASSYAAQSAT